MKKRDYSIGEEIFNSITHGVGALLSLIALILLLVSSFLKGNTLHAASALVYSLTLFTLYLFSTLYHAIPNKKAKSVFKIFDHSSIFLLIAGTYTPFTLITIGGDLGWRVFAIIWSIAIFGILKEIFIKKKMVVLSTLIYLSMGWMVVFVLKPVVSNLPFWGLIWLIIGGLFYTAGTAFYIVKKIPYFHSVWHLFVLAGSVSHFICIYFYVV
ncbi:hemolysin D [Tepiditoga spiralis]|uniref:Hemolysin D n=1 Tax=Tepiditoga spiralis TaxID=2108365 RepID=A0A7G1G5N0_9BACT|nr:hemolysin III family protein [Tepiditoga spiralis]BBE30197.1 hemolysin D [Tepiditoga spiralis]